MQKKNKETQKDIFLLHLREKRQTQQFCTTQHNHKIHLNEQNHKNSVLPITP